MQNCNNGINIPILEVDPCNGQRVGAECVVDSGIYSELSLSANATQQQINQAQYLASLNTKAVTDSLQTQIDLIPEDVIIVNYSILTSLITDSSLIKGKKYFLSDYMTTYTQPITLSTKSSGIVEPLFLTATDVNKLSNIAYSQLYPQDIIYYEVTGDIGNGYGNEGFTKGKIYRRIDTQRNNDIGTDWRHVKYDRSGIDKLLFEDYEGCENNTIKTYYLFDNVIDNYFYSNTIGNYFEKNTIGNFCNTNTIKDNCHSNTIGNSFYSNIIEKSFYLNTISGNFYSNYIAEGFITNIIGSSFYSNIIGNAFRDNVIGDNFYKNTTKVGFTNNNIENNFYLNTIGYDFVLNSFTNLPIINNIFENRINNKFNIYVPSVAMQNLTTSTVIFLLPDGTLKERYYDNTTTLIINSL